MNEHVIKAMASTPFLRLMTCLHRHRGGTASIRVQAAIVKMAAADWTSTSIWYQTRGRNTPRSRKTEDLLSL